MWEDLPPVRAACRRVIVQISISRSHRGVGGGEGNHILLHFLPSLPSGPVPSVAITHGLLSDLSSAHYCSIRCLGVRRKQPPSPLLMFSGVTLTINGELTKKPLAWLKHGVWLLDKWEGVSVSFWCEWGKAAGSSDTVQKRYTRSKITESRFFPSCESVINFCIVWNTEQMSFCDIYIFFNTDQQDRRQQHAKLI